MSLLLLTVNLRGVSNKHCLLSLFSFVHFSFSLTNFFITDFSASFLDRVFKFCKHNEDNQMYYWKQNQGAEIYFHLLFLFSFFLSLTPLQ